MTTALTNYGGDYFTWRVRSIPFGDLMTRDERYEAEATYRCFLVNKPNPPEHAAFIARAVHVYPKLPVGAAQNALHCLETLGPAVARRYVSNASARQSQHERALMGTTLATWHAKRSDQARPYVYEGVCRYSPKRQREERDRLDRYHAHMSAGQVIVAQQRNKAERRLAREIAAVSAPIARVVVEPISSDIVAALVALLKSPDGVSYAEAAQRLNLQPKGDKPHHAPAAQIRALVRDKVRKLYPVASIANDPARGGTIYRLNA